MKVQFLLDLDNREDHEVGLSDQRKLKVLAHLDDIALALWDFQQELRTKCREEYCSENEELTQEQKDARNAAYEDARDMFNKAFEEREVSFFLND